MHFIVFNDVQVEDPDETEVKKYTGSGVDEVDCPVGSHTGKVKYMYNLNPSLEKFANELG